MGYESRLYVIQKFKKTCTNWDNGKEIDNGEIINNKKMYYGEMIAKFNLCKCYAVSDYMREKEETEYYFYDNSDEPITEDLYGSPLREMTLDEAIKIIETAQKQDKYRRYPPILAMLKSFKEHEKEWNELAVLHYGY